jgi:hypothetical protein
MQRRGVSSFMEAKTSQTQQIPTSVLLLLGIDQAFRLLSREERERVVAKVKTELQRMTLGEFGDMVAGLRPLAAPPKPKRVVIKPTNGKSDSFAGIGPKLHDALKEVLADGAQPIAKIADSLMRKGVTSDVTPETKKKICAYIALDKTFACKTRGIYQLRVRVN